MPAPPRFSFVVRREPRRGARERQAEASANERHWPCVWSICYMHPMACAPEIAAASAADWGETHGNDHER
jgi:hypothetical protein